MKRVPLIALVVLSLAIAASLRAAEFFVSPAGSDANRGTKEQPFATLERARDAVRAWRKSAGRVESATLWLRSGTFFLTQPFELGAEDSGSAAAPFVIRSAEGETATLCGARRLKAADFKPVTDATTLARITPEARGKIVVANLQDLGVSHRRRYPDVFNDNGGIVELYFNGKRMPLSRYPNEGYMTIKRVLVNGGGQAERGKWGDPTLKQSPKGPGVFEYRDERHARWVEAARAGGLWFKGYWRCVWQNEAVRVSAIDPQQRTVTLAKPLPGGIGSKYHRPEGSGEEKYWLMNLLEEVDRPGEWCLDFASGKLFFWPPKPLDTAEILLADNAASVVQVVNASNIVLRQLTIEGSLDHGVVIRGGASNAIAGCTVRNVSRYGAVLDGGFGHAVQSCDLYDLGAGGVWLGGGDETATPRVPAGHRVVNNHIHHFARIEKVYAPGVNAGFTGGGGGGHHPAVGMLVAHNLIHDTPHGGVLFGSWDSLFEFNEVNTYCEVSNDLNAFYSYDQFARMGNHTFRYNFMHSTADGDGIYFDHDHRDMHVYGNVACFNSTGKRGTAFLYKSGSQTKNPQTIDCTNNIAVNCNYGFVFVTARPSRIENNVAVNCPKPFSWQEVKDGQISSSSDALASGRNLTYTTAPGFVSLAKMDFRLKPDARLFKELPGFQAIPFDKIGLYLDEYRRRLPADVEAGRVRTQHGNAEAGYEVLDRE